jgi:hypothetical protein
MKWLKLDCDFQDDPKVRLLMEQWGAEKALSFWPLLLAFVGAHSRGTCRVKVDPAGEFTPQYIAKRLHTKPSVLPELLRSCGQLALICPDSWGQNSEIFIPNMMKRVDEYTQKLRTKSRYEAPTLTYPRNKKKDKSLARAREGALAPDLGNRGIPTPNGIHKNRNPSIDFHNHSHRCRFCPDEHDWLCDDPDDCTLTREIACPDYRQRLKRQHQTSAPAGKR